MKIPVWLATIAVLVFVALVGYWGVRADQKVDSLDDKITDPKTGLAARVSRIEGFLQAKMNYERDVSKLFKEMYKEAPEAEKSILIKDAALFQISPAIFLETHKDLKVIKQYDQQIKNLIQIQTPEFTPPK